MASKLSLQDIKTPVDPDNFVDVFCAKFQKWGNAITEELKETWKQNCLAMNNAIQFKNDAKKFVISAPTGSAKTENVITYCAILPTNIRVVISTNLTDEADRLARDINQESQDKRACAYHSKNKLNLDDTSNYQVMVTTHAFYEKNNMSLNKWEKAVGDRDLVIIDEALTTIREISLNINEVTIAFNFFEALRRDKCFKKLNFPPIQSEDSEGDFIKDNVLAYEIELNNLIIQLNDITEILNNPQEGTYLKRSDTMIDIADDGNPPQYIKAITLSSLNNFRRILKQHKFNPNKLLTGIDDESSDREIQKNILDTLNNLSAINQRQAYVTANQGVKSLNNVKDYLPKQSVVCFDATADINQIYALRENYHNDLVLIPRIPNVRDYSNVTLHCASTLTGKQNYTKEVFTSLLHDVKFGNKTLLVTNKINKDALGDVMAKDYSQHVTDIATWGAITGLNNWKDYDTCVLLGLSHKPKQFIQNRALISTDEKTAFGPLQSKLNIDIETSDLTSEIVQAINRIRIRTVTSNDGKCDSANIYITLPSSNYTEYIRLIKEHMDNININNWDIDTLNSDKSTYDQIIDYLSSNLQSGGKIKLNTPRDELKINSETYRSVVGKTKNAKNDFKEKLLKLGYEIIDISEPDDRGRPRIKPTTYIHKI